MSGAITSFFQRNYINLIKWFLSLCTSRSDIQYVVLFAFTCSTISTRSTTIQSSLTNWDAYQCFHCNSYQRLKVWSVDWSAFEQLGISLFFCLDLDDFAGTQGQIVWLLWDRNSVGLSSSWCLLGAAISKLAIKLWRHEKGRAIRQILFELLAFAYYLHELFIEIHFKAHLFPQLWGQLPAEHSAITSFADHQPNHKAIVYSCCKNGHEDKQNTRSRRVFIRFCYFWVYDATKKTLSY